MTCFSNRWEKGYPLDGAATKWEAALRRKGLSTRWSHLSILSKRFLFYFILLDFYIFFKVIYFDFIKLYHIYILSSGMIILIILIIQGFIFSIELLIWFSPLYNLGFLNSLILWTNLQVSEFSRVYLILDWSYLYMATIFVNWN